MNPIRMGERILDRALVSKDWLRCGKVDDLLLEWNEGEPERGPAIEAIVTGPTALAQQWGRLPAKLVKLTYRLLGVDDPEPVAVPWQNVESLGVFIHLNRSRAQLHLDRIDNGIGERFIRPLPGS